MDIQLLRTSFLTQSRHWPWRCMWPSGEEATSRAAGWHACRWPAVQGRPSMDNWMLVERGPGTKKELLIRLTC